MRIAFGIFFAIALHVGFLLFGGLIFGNQSEKADAKKIVEVSLEDPAAEKKKIDKKDPEETPEEKLSEAKDAPPDADQIIKDLDRTSAGPPALAQMDLGSMSALLNGGGGAEGFGQAEGSFASGGVVGGKGKVGALGEKEEETFSAADIDQKPRALYQTAATFPAEMRGKNMDGAVVVLFIVGPDGRVGSPKVESASHPAFEKPALEAVRQWRFEPGLRGGKKVATRMKVTVRFQRS